MTLSYLLVDIASVSLANILGFVIWGAVNPSLPPLGTTVGVVAGLAVAAFAGQGLYPGVGLAAVEHLRRTTKGVTAVYLVLTTSMFLGKQWGVASRGVFIVSWLLAVLVVPMLRSLVRAVVARCSWWGAPTMVLGAGATARLIIRNLSENRGLGLRPVCCLDDNPTRLGECAGVPVVGDLSQAASIAECHDVKYAILAIPGLPRAELVTRLVDLSNVFPRVIVIPDLLGIASLWTTPRDLGGVLGLEVSHNLLSPSNRLIKRLVDIVISSLLLVPMILVVAMAGLLIKIVDPGPALFCQLREGKNGKRIRVWKLRTMFVNAEEMLVEHLAKEPLSRQEWDEFRKLRRDPRILPRVGRLFRQISLDELPQIWNVLIGDMSLVGPRPFPSYHNAAFEPAFRSLRTRVTPGLTGFWQVTARSCGNLQVQAALDTFYIHNWSLWLDVYILARTLGAVVLARGAR